MFWFTQKKVENSLKEDGYGLINCAGHCEHLLSATQSLHNFGDKFDAEWQPEAITKIHDSLQGPCAPRRKRNQKEMQLQQQHYNVFQALRKCPRNSWAFETRSSKRILNWYAIRKYVFLKIGCKKKFSSKEPMNLSILGLKHEFWTIPTANMTYTSSQNYTNMVISEHGMEYKHSKLWLLCYCFCCCHLMFLSPTSAHPLFFVFKWIVQIYLNGTFVTGYEEYHFYNLSTSFFICILHWY